MPVICHAKTSSVGHARCAASHIVCQEDSYLKELVRYIYLNAVRAGIIESLKELNRYAYCGHSAVMGKKKRPWQHVDYVPGYFGKTAKRAKKVYFNYVVEPEKIR